MLLSFLLMVLPAALAVGAVLLVRRFLAPPGGFLGGQRDAPSTR